MHKHGEFLVIHGLCISWKKYIVHEVGYSWTLCCAGLGETFTWLHVPSTVFLCVRVHSSINAMLWFTVMCLNPSSCSPAYETKQSVITVVPGCTHPLPITTNAAVVRSYTGTRKVLPDSLSTAPNTQLTFAGRPLLYSRHKLSSISIVLFDPTMVSEEVSM